MRDDSLGFVVPLLSWIERWSVMSSSVPEDETRLRCNSGLVFSD